MVAHPRTAVRADRLRALNRPRPVEVECVSDQPVALTQNGRQTPVAEVLDTWLIEEGWWWIPLARRYFHLLLADGRPVTVFADLIDGGWYQQRYDVRVAVGAFYPP